MAEPVSTVPELLARRCRVDADRPAIVTAEDTITYAGLDAASAEVATGLAAAGVARGDRLGLLAPNGIPWAVTALGALRIGAVLVPLSTLLRPPELAAQLNAAAVEHLVLAPGFRDRNYLDDLDVVAPDLRRVLGGGARHDAVPTLRTVWSLDDLPGPGPDGPPVDRDVDPHDDLAVLFTSGSRGVPKGTIHTHRSALWAVAAGLDARCVRPGERLYIPMPFFWTGGFSGGLFTALVAGATLVTEAEPEPERTLALLEAERVTLFRGWPDQAARLAAHPAFSRTDLSALGDGSLGALLPADRRPAPGARANLFGMTETFGPYCGERLDVDLPAAARGSCGRPFPGVEVRIVDPDGEVVCGPGVDGEIWLRGPNLMRGICGRPPSSVFTAEGWYRTGDLGRRDEAGYLWYLGRLDDMVKVKGASVYPTEVEAALRAVPGVRQAHVTDVADAAGAPAVGAVVVTDLPLEEVRGGVRERLSSFKVPSVWWLARAADEVPLLASGKVDTAALREMLRHGTEEARP